MKTPDIIEEIARDTFANVETLEIRHSDGLDFHSVSVSEIKSALLQAYGAGAMGIGVEK